MDSKTIFYVNLSGICHKGKLLKEENGRYLGKYLTIKNSESEEIETIFPENIRNIDFYKKYKNQRVNRGRRYGNEEK